MTAEASRQVRVRGGHPWQKIVNEAETQRCVLAAKRAGQRRTNEGGAPTLEFVLSKATWHCARGPAPVIIRGMRALCIFGVASLTACSLMTSLNGFSDREATPDNHATSGEEPDNPEGTKPLKDAGASSFVTQVDGAFGAFCKDAGSASFCLDFDDGIPPEFSVFQTGDNTITVDTSASVSAPASLLMAYNASTDRTGASLDRVIGPITSELTVEFDLAVEQVGGGEAMDVLRLDGQPPLGVNISTEGGVRLKTYSLEGEQLKSAEIGIAHTTFRHVKWVARRNSTSVSNELYYEGKTVTYETIDAVFNASIFQIGDHGITPTGAWRVRIDNVVVTIT